MPRRVELFTTPWAVPTRPSVRETLQARALEWAAIAFSRDLPHLGSDMHLLRWQVGSFPAEPPRKPAVPNWTIKLFSTSPLPSFTWDLFFWYKPGYISFSPYHFFLYFFLFFFWYAGFLIKLFSEVSIIAFFSFIFISCRLITLQYCSGFCHTLTWISHGFTCIPHPDPPSHLPLYPIPRVFPVHQARAVVLCIQPGLVICFTIDNIHVSMLFSQNKKYGTLHEFACHPCAGVMLIFSVSFQF